MASFKILYLDSFTDRKADSNASDEIGYGITCSASIKAELIRRGHIVEDLESHGVMCKAKLEWILATYELLSTKDMSAYDVILVFHSFHQFPCEIRRFLQQRHQGIPLIVGYVHGSHWDESDTFRTEFFPGLKIQDLANMICMDRVFIVSEYFKSVLLNRISGFNEDIGHALRSKMAVVGLPINIELIERYRTARHDERVRIVFNHSPTVAKDPVTFFQVIEPILSHYPVELIITRKFESHHPGFAELHSLVDRFSGRVILGNTLSIPEYYRTLWGSDIQVSTAKHESLGISTLEAMYTRNCCILPNRQSFPEISATETAHLYDSNNELGSMVARLIEDSSERNRIAEKQHRLSLQYSPVRVVDRLLSAINELLE